MSNMSDSYIYNAQLDAFTLYHIVQDTPANYPDHSFGRDGSVGPALPALGNAIAGSIATAATKGLLYPLDLVIARMQVQRKMRGENETASAARDAGAEYEDVLDAARKIYKNEGGIKAFYTGCPPDILKGLTDSFLFFLAYTFVRNYQLKKAGTKNLSVFRELSVGVVAGTISKLVTTPIQNIVTRQQTAALVAARHPSSTPEDGDKKGIADIARQIYAERGLVGFWAGYNYSIVLTSNPAITFAVDNLLQKLLPRSKRENPSSYITFLIAAVSKVVATSITYPVTLAKSRAQAITSSPEKENKDSKEAKHETKSVQGKAKLVAHTAVRLLWAQYGLYIALRDIYREEGVSGLYSGLEADILKGFLSHGFTMMAKDKVHTGVISLYYVLLKMTRKWPDELKRAQESAAIVAAQAKEQMENAAETVVDGAMQLVNNDDA
ncbi:Hypothetical protein R9X50_00607600 [Acrodontium crateriforme]|uniref:Mitochondrial carrier n=1 Tax=Acrodontium crateriforme TaxID=150365 RepID=A0AAQ3M940_9PEZI|nr:Hypothetical protein R9X50_00607600 [Acrodontium crateriforme]